MSSGYGERQHIGSEIRRLRREQGWTLDDLAEQAGLSASHLSRMERGLTVPSFTVLAGLGQALGVSLEHFAQLEDEVVVLNQRLREQLAGAGVSEGVVEEIVTLSVSTRRALSQALDA